MRGGFDLYIYPNRNWTYHLSDQCEVHVVLVVVGHHYSIRCGNPHRQGDIRKAFIPPKTWPYILIVLVAPHAINERGGLQWMEECETIECQNLAMAQPVDEQFESCVIFDKGLRVEHLVLTRSHDHLMCVSASDLFNIQKLHVEKIWTETSRKRLHGRIAQTGIVELAKKRRQDYATAVVLARLAADKNVKDNLLTNPLQWHISMTSPLLLFWRVKSKSKWHERSRVISLRSLLKDLHWCWDVRCHENIFYSSFACNRWCSHQKQLGGDTLLAFQPHPAHIPFTSIYLLLLICFYVFYILRQCLWNGYRMHLLKIVDFLNKGTKNILFRNQACKF